MAFEPTHHDQHDDQHAKQTRVPETLTRRQDKTAQRKAANGVSPAGGGDQQV